MLKCVRVPIPLEIKFSSASPACGKILPQLEAASESSRMTLTVTARGLIEAAENIWFKRYY